MDYDDVVVHIFKRGVREHYGLDRLGADAKRLPLPKARTAVTASRPKVRMQREQTARQRGYPMRFFLWVFTLIAAIVAAVYFSDLTPDPITLRLSKQTSTDV